MGRLRFFALSATAVVALAVVGCSSSDPGVSSGPSGTGGTGTTVTTAGSVMTTMPAADVVTTDMLVGQTFVSTSVTGHDLAPDSEIRMSFRASDLTANAGCNTMNGAYALEGGALVVADDLSATMMACPEPLMGQDTWLQAWLQADPAITATVEGISLTAEGVTVELAAEGAGGTDGGGGIPLVGPTWKLTGIGSGDAVSSVPVGVDPPTLVFADDGTVAVFAGCNRGSTAFTPSEEPAEGAAMSMTFGPLATTMMACEPDVQGVETSVVAVLDGTVGFDWVGATLTFTNGDQSLIFDTP